jgi:hypothetical protein
MAVRVKAAEFCLLTKNNVKEAVSVLLGLSDKKNSNYYVACDAVECLDRYREHLDEEAISKLKSIPTDFKEIRRGNDNMKKLMRRFTK